MKVFHAALAFILLVTGVGAEDEHEYASLQRTSIALPAIHGLPELLGKRKLVLLNFFAPWCPNSNYEAPFLRRLQKQFGAKGLTLIGISEYAGMEQTSAYQETHRLRFPVISESTEITDPVRRGTEHYKLRTKLGDRRKWGTPFTLILVDGKPAFYVRGEMIPDEIVPWLEKRLK